MSHHERVKNAQGKNKELGNDDGPHLWPDCAPYLSPEAEKIVGEKISWLINSLEKRAELGPDGYAAFDRGTLPWGKSSLSWETRTYDQHLLDRDYENQLGDDKIRVIFVVTAQEEQENLAQEQARLATLRAQYFPPKVCPEYKGKRAFRSKKQSAARSRVTAQD